jgi:hypothetical protein
VSLADCHLLLCSLRFPCSLRPHKLRVGNGAWNHHQNDVWGMLVDAVDSHLHRGAEQIFEPV